MPDAYLILAERVLRESSRPLHPKEIVEIAKEIDVFPEHLHGKTVYKTLAARLSTDIQRQKDKSIFFRTAPNIFFLKELKTENETIHIAPRRKKTIHNEIVLTISSREIARKIDGEISKDIEGFFKTIESSTDVKFEIRKRAEARFDIKQLITYIIVRKKNQILTYRRGSFNNSSDELKGLRSIGFGGHVESEDYDLFSTDRFGIENSARREISEELKFDELELSNLHHTDSLHMLCLLNTNESEEARKHFALVMIYYCTGEFSPKKNELSISDLRWMDLPCRENSLNEFEPWSKSILAAIDQGDLKLE